MMYCKIYASKSSSVQYKEIAQMFWTYWPSSMILILQQALFEDFLLKKRKPFNKLYLLCTLNKGEKNSTILVTL